MALINLVPVLKGVKPGWVALSRDYKKVVAHGNDYSALIKKLEGYKKNSVVLMPVVKNFRGLVTNTR